MQSRANENVASRVRALLFAGMAGPVWFTIMVVVQGILRPDYSHVSLPISALTAFPTGWIQVVNFCVLGSLTTAFAFGLHAGVEPTRRGGAGVALLALSRIGIVLAGVFPWKMVNGVPTETAPHVVAAVISFAATGLGLIVFSRRMTADPHWQPLARYTLVTGIVILVLFVLLGFFAVDDGTPFHPWAGLIQRALCAVWFACVMVLAFRLRGLTARAIRPAPHQECPSSWGTRAPKAAPWRSASAARMASAEPT